MAKDGRYGKTHRNNNHLEHIQAIHGPFPYELSG
jgi:hypothetical protein